MSNTNALQYTQAFFFNMLRHFFNTPNYTHLTIKCYGMVWPVHRIIVCPQSPFLAMLCDGAASHDGSTTLEFNDENPKALDAMLRYLYWNNYSDKLLGHESKSIMLNLLVHELADKFVIPKLAVLATEKFRSRVEVGWESDAFAEAAMRIFSAKSGTSNDELRAIVVGVVMAHEELLVDEGCGEGFCAVMDATPALYNAIGAERAKRSFAGRKRRYEEMASEAAIASLMAEEEEEFATDVAIAKFYVEEVEEQGGKWFSCNNCKSTESEGDILATTGFYHYCVHCHVGDEPDVWLARPAKRLRT
ncbi:hypothetical protein LTR17_022609 [Elasticomyces elasticus]|nr:hypothetical protein LTR17_022609 [Elasticomyces elasticus]